MYTYIIVYVYIYYITSYYIILPPRLGSPGFTEAA